MIHATDTDVVVLAIAVSSVLKDCEIWVAFGHGSKLRYVPFHLISAELGNGASWGLLFLLAISGCDTVSAFYGIGKKTAWAVWRSMPQVTPPFLRLSRAPTQISPDEMEQIKKLFFCISEHQHLAIRIKPGSSCSLITLRWKTFLQHYMP